MSVLDSSTKKRKTKGLVIVHTGSGKGKTTAALGLLLRAWGHDMKVSMLQFIKRPTAERGEHRAARRIGVELLAGGAGRSQNSEMNRRLSLDLWRLAGEKIGSGAYNMIILDEFTYPLLHGWVPVEELLNVLRNRPEEVHVVITGRDAPQELIDFADMVTDMRAVKHALQKGIKAQPGVEF